MLATGDEPSVRYACLELRLCIEYLTYDHLEGYLDEASDAVLEKWTPKQIIDALRDVDPEAEQSHTVFIGLTDEPGDLAFLAESKRFTGKWANTHHNALGSFLHAPTLGQIGSGKAPLLSDVARKATDIADSLTDVLDSELTRWNVGNFYEFFCSECGKSIKRRAGSFEEKGLVCRNASCGATYDVSVRTAEQVEFQMRKRWYTCPTCRKLKPIGAHRVVPGAIIECAGCHGRFKVALIVKPETETGRSETQ